MNLPTILSTSAERHQIPVHLDRVNIDVLLEVWPSQFIWHHGDGTSQTTSTPGKAWTEGANLAELITHTYAKTSKGLQLSVDTTWSAQFKVVGQPDWRPVDGTVAITGAPVDVAVLEAEPQPAPPSPLRPPSAQSAAPPGSPLGVESPGDSARTAPTTRIATTTQNAARGGPDGPAPCLPRSRQPGSSRLAEN